VPALLTIIIGVSEWRVIDLRRLNGSMTRVRESGPLASLLPVMLGALLLASLAIAAGPSSANWLFQSPVSPIGSGPAGTTAAPEGTVAGPALVAVPTTPNFLPWIIGLLVVAAIVGAAVIWSRGSGERGSNE
jgi:hypothetical protein